MDSDTFYKFRVQQGKIYNSTKKILDNIEKNEDGELFVKLFKDIFEYNRVLVSESLYNTALNNYETLYFKINGKRYVNKFLQNIDITEILYNIGYLKFLVGDSDKAIYYFAEADKEYSKFNNKEEGHLIKDLIISQGYMTLGNAISSIYTNCFNFDSLAYAFKYYAFFGKEDSSEDRVKELFLSFDTVLLLQFTVTVDRYWNWLPLHHNIIKAIRITRTIGEMVWLFECYLKQILNEPKETLNPLINTLIRNNEDIKKEYVKFEYMNKGNNDEKIQYIKELLERQQRETAEVYIAIRTNY